MDYQNIPSFESRVPEEYKKTASMDVLQVNVGRLCNLACKHCHVDAGPARTEIMEKETFDKVLALYKKYGFQTLDITGGAPEMNPHFREFMEEAVTLCDDIIVRSNGVILLEEAYADLPEFFKAHVITIFISLPHYSKKPTDKQRGDGVFDGVIEAIQRLNEIGYGKDDNLALNLVYNPSGAFFPPPQGSMEREYKEKLWNDYGIVFTNLFTITNNPTGRFKDFLVRSDNEDMYMEKLVNAFNPQTVEGLMCRSQISVGYDGTVYDCDFNQAAELPLEGKKTLDDLLEEDYTPRNIRFGSHCYGCTAGAGSSCGGTVVGDDE